MAQTRRLFISLADADSRAILNWPEVEQVLARHGFESVCLGDVTLEEQMATFASAERVVGVHGAGLTNILFSAPGTKILEILPQMVATPVYWMLAQACGHSYHALIANDPELPRPDYTNWGHHPEYNRRDLIVDPARLDAALSAVT